VYLSSRTRRSPLPRSRAFLGRGISIVTRLTSSEAPLCTKSPVFGVHGGYLLLVFSLGLVSSCGLSGHQNSKSVPFPQFILRLSNQTVMHWPASASDQTANAAALSGDGLYVANAGDPVPWQWGQGRNLAAGPWGATGLLDLPLSNPPRRCSAVKKWNQLAGLISDYESKYEIPRSAISLGTFGETGNSAPQAVEDQDCAEAARVDCLRVVFEAMPQVPRTRGNAVAMLHPMFKYSRHYNGCFQPAAMIEASKNASTFDFADGRMVFTPARVFSILIFSGAHPSLAKALENSAPAAVVPIPAGCSGTQDSAACLESPLPLSACLGCANLVAEQLYSVFLIIRPGVLDEQILPVLLRVPRQE
jgi:hypothetical protein